MTLSIYNTRQKSDSDSMLVSETLKYILTEYLMTPQITFSCFNYYDVRPCGFLFTTHSSFGVHVAVQVGFLRRECFEHVRFIQSSDFKLLFNKPIE